MKIKLSAKAQASLDSVVERLKSGDLSPVTRIARITRHPDDDCPMAHWSFNNVVLAYLQTGSLDCRGYRQWQEVGRQVKKGSSAAFIFAPINVYKKGADGKPLVEDGHKVVAFTRFRTIPVFPVESTEGEPLPDFNYAPTKLPPLVDVATHMGVKATWTPLPPDRLADYSPTKDAIRVGTHGAAEFFHELAHAVHARVLKARGETIKGGQQEEQETVAEFTASVLMDLYNIGDTTGNSWAYIQKYAKDPIEAVMASLKDVEAILAAIEQAQAEMGLAQAA